MAWRLVASDETYPARLRGLTRPPPLDGVGDLGVGPAVAVVGSRAASAAAIAAAHAAAQHAARRGVRVISGGAIGVDTAAHRGALDGRGATTVVVGTGLDRVYPERNAGLFARVIAQGGAVVSMFPAGAEPKRWHFVARNTVIAALADVVVIVAAEARSGSLSTAEAARRLGRPLLAVPGTAGTDRLIARGHAGPLTELADLDRALDGQPPRPRARVLTEEEAAIVACLGDGAVELTAVAAALGWRPAAVAAVLAALVDAGAVTVDVDERYRAA